MPSPTNAGRTVKFLDIVSRNRNEGIWKLSNSENPSFYDYVGVFAQKFGFLRQFLTSPLSDDDVILQQTFARLNWNGSFRHLIFRPSAPAEIKDQMWREALQ
jgi:hypothetical protein